MKSIHKKYIFLTSFIIKVLLVQPEDQDFDVSLVARSQGSLMEVEMVKVREGQEDRFTQLRNKYKARARSSSNVQDVQVFRVVQVILNTLLIFQ